MSYLAYARQEYNKYKPILMKISVLSLKLPYDAKERNKNKFKMTRGWAVLDLSPILFIKLKLYCARFVPLHKFKNLFHKISVDLVLRFTSLTCF